MTKREATAEFSAMYPYWTFQRPGKRIDKPMRAEAWNNFTDALCKEGRITMMQYESWSHPWRD